MPPVETLEEVIQLKLSEAMMADTSHKVSAHGQEERREIQYEARLFQINRGHAYRDHATGPATNPRYGGPDKAVEKAIMDDVIARLQAGPLPPVRGIALPGTGVLVHGVPIRYNAVTINRPTAPGGVMYMISDYMVWQGDPGALARHA